MLTVSISVNGEPIFARSAHRRTRRHNKGNMYAYMLDTGEVIYHDYEDGAVKLAQKMLKTIKDDYSQVMTSTADLPEPDETLDEILLHYSEAAGGTGGRAILILESDIPALTAAIAAHTKAAVIEARIDELNHIQTEYGGRYLGTTYINGRGQKIDDRIQELKQQLKGGTE